MLYRVFKKPGEKYMLLQVNGNMGETWSEMKAFNTKAERDKYLEEQKEFAEKDKSQGDVSNG